MNNRVCAVVVTYNRRELLIECLDALKGQTRPLDGVYIIDNHSQDGTGQLLFEQGYLKVAPPDTVEEAWEMDSEIGSLRISYLRMPYNVGGTGGYYEGLKRACQSGYGWMWLLDDDALPGQDALEELSKYFDQDVAALASVVLTPDQEVLVEARGQMEFNHIFPLLQKPLNREECQDNPVVVDFASFVGILLAERTINQVGLPKREFFMYHDDVEYCIRLKQAGQILLVNSSPVYHPPLQGQRVREGVHGRSLEKIPTEEFWKEYYGTRNLVWIGKTYGSPRFYLEVITNYLKTMALLLIFYEDRYEKARIITSAYWDGLTGNFHNQRW